MKRTRSEFRRLLRPRHGATAGSSSSVKRKLCAGTLLDEPAVAPSVCRRRRHRRNSAGFSLLEVILALGILAGAVAVLGEVGRNGLNQARRARDVTVAQLLCESKMAEVTAGITPAETVIATPFETTDDSSQPDWLYSIEVETIDDQGLTAVRVTVAQDLPVRQRPVDVSLTRWIYETDTETTADTTLE